MIGDGRCFKGKHLYGTVRVDASVDDVTDRGVYDVALEVTGGANGTLTLVDIVIESFCVGGTDDGKLCVGAADCASPGVCVVRPDYVFASGGGTEACGQPDVTNGWYNSC